MTVKINISPLLIIISSGIKITANTLVNESSLNRKIKNIMNKRRNKKVSEKGRIKSRARWNSKTASIRFKSFYWSKLL